MDQESPNNNTNNSTRPMVEAVSELPSTDKKKKTGLIIGIIAGVVILAGTVIAVVLAKSLQKIDPFDAALQKLFSQEEVRNTKLDGTIKVTMQDTTSGISSVNLNIESQIAGASLANNTRVAAELKLQGGQTISPEIEGVYAESGDFYFKPSGLALGFGTLAGYPYESLPKSHPVIQLIDEIDNQWLLTSADDVKEFVSSEDEGIGKVDDESISCVSDFMKGFNRNSYSLTDIYKKHPFIGSTQTNLTVAKKNNPIYKVVIDRGNLVAFAEEFNGTQMVTDFLQCANATRSPFNEETIDAVLSILPEVYLEIDNNYDISRFYSALSLDDFGFDTVIDFDISHPDIVNITEPAEYKNFSDVLGDFMTKLPEMLQES